MTHPVTAHGLLSIEDVFLARELVKAAARALGVRLGAEIRAEAGPLYKAHFGNNGW